MEVRIGFRFVSIEAEARLVVPRSTTNLIIFIKKDLGKFNDRNILFPLTDFFLNICQDVVLCVNVENVGLEVATRAAL